jgi:hypothetical protein
MDHADLGGGGPFAYYPVTGDAIRDAASQTDAQTGLVDSIRRQVEGEHRRMLAAVEGDLEAPMQEAPALAIGNMVRVAQASQFAAGVLRLFADAVDQFNHTSSAPRSVDALNTAYGEARIADFGLDRVNGSAWDDANAALLGRLRAEYGRLQEQLDMWADHAARMLDRGPTADDVLELWALGALAPDAADTWPGLDLNHVPVWRLPYELRDEVGDRSLESLSDDQLMALWEDHGYRPARELLGPRIAYDIQTRADLDEFNLKINPSYWKAISEGMPEQVARLYAEANPGNFLMIYAPWVIGGQIAYDVLAKDSVDAFKDDPLSLRFLGEGLMTVSLGGRLARLDRVIDTVRALRKSKRLFRTSQHLGPSVVHVPGDMKLPGVPRGAIGTPTNTGKGLVYDIERGTAELDPRVAQVRVMNPVTSGTHVYPRGYVVYMNEAGQTVNPLTGRTIPPNDPFAHIALK